MRGPRGRGPREARIRREVEEEVAFHLEATVERLVAEGMGPEDARREAARIFGDAARVRREYTALRSEWEARVEVGGRAARVALLLGQALRGLRRAPATALAAVAVLALGLGAASAVYAVAHGVLAGGTPGVREAGLLAVHERTDEGTAALLSPPTFRSWRAAESITLAAAMPSEWVWAEGPEPVRIPGAQVTWEFFDVVGVAPALGRALAPGDETPGAPPVVVLSHALWTGVFGADPAAVGAGIRLDGVIREVVGVLPPGFDFPAGARYWAPVDGAVLEVEIPYARYVRTLGRLAPDGSLDRARAELDAITARDPDAIHTGAVLQDRRAWETQDVRSPLLLLLGAVGLVVLIATTNAGSLLLARTLRRRREIAIHTALGAGRLEVVARVLVEGAALGLAGGVLALAASAGSLEAIRALLPEIPGADRIRIDASVAAFTLLAALATGLAAGLLPAMRAVREGRGDLLRGAGTAHTRSRVTAAIRAGMVVVQVALALSLIAGAGSLLRTLRATLAEEPGFRTDGRVAFTLSLPAFRYGNAESRRSFIDGLVDAISEDGAASSVAVTENLPFSGRSMVSTAQLDGEDQARSAVQVEGVLPGYFATLGIPLVAGRSFTRTDVGDGEPVALVNDAFAREHLGGSDPLTRTVRVGFGGGHARRIVGVVADSRHAALTAPPTPKVYLPTDDPMGGSFTLVAASELSTGVLVARVRAAVRALDPEQPISRIAPLSELVAGAAAGSRQWATLLSGFGLLALVLAVAGYYATLSGLTVERTREIGIRMALGADTGRVGALVVRQGLGITAVGVLVGLPCAWGSTRLLESLLYGVPPGDPVTLAATASLFLAVALAATWVPVRRATRVDPLRVLKEDG